MRSWLRSWWRRVQPVNPWKPGHSALERMRALDHELPSWEMTETYRRLREAENASTASLVVRVRIEN